MMKTLELCLRLNLSRDIGEDIPKAWMHELLENLANAIVTQANESGLSPDGSEAGVESGVIWHPDDGLWASFSMAPTDIHQGEDFTGDPNHPDDRYVLRDGGAKCPSCGSTEISADGYPDPDGKAAVGKVHCDSCKAAWEEVWTLTGLLNVEEA